MAGTAARPTDIQGNFRREPGTKRIHCKKEISTKTEHRVDSLKKKNG
jgi:hypothetical protein